MKQLIFNASIVSGNDFEIIDVNGLFEMSKYSSGI